jgi:predicted outer membrane repeat protein
MTKRWGSALLAVVGLTLCGAGFLASPAVAAKPECSVENLPPQKRSYNSNTDGNPLGAAIAEAKAGDTLMVIGTCHGNFVVDKSLTLRGRAALTQLDSLDGNGSGTVLSIRGSPSSADAITVEIRDLEIANGDVGMSRSSSPISSAYSNVTLTDSTVTDNAGYGIRDAAFTGDGTCRGALTLNRSTVRRNGAGGILMGHLCTPYTFNYSVVSDNTGIGISAPTSLLAFVGGVTLNHSTVSRNDVGISWVRGGALTIHDSIVSDNRGAGIRYGGNSAAAGPVIDNSIISGNMGGGIVVSFATLTLRDSTVNGNSTGGNGGGIIVIAPGTVTLTRSTISGNTAAGDGGGIYSDMKVILSGSTVSGNTAGGSGGGIYNSADFAHLGGGTVTLTGSTVSGNTAGAFGGGIFNETGGTVTLDDTSSVCGNSPDDWQGCLP